MAAENYLIALEGVALGIVADQRICWGGCFCSCWLLVFWSCSWCGQGWWKLSCVSSRCAGMERRGEAGAFGMLKVGVILQEVP